ncbi:hypothetical protein [Rubritalea marina]|uniref:hypothetical protein n=1 Tax=Rubritalea marina TaxID=361055 RepID=UPI000362B71E|nr:hypothetical protein [Rubritalea marina]
MIEEIVTPLVNVVLRAMGWIFFEVLVQFIIAWPGKILCRLFGKNVDIDSGSALVVGIIFWIGFFAVVYTMLRQ